MPLSTSTKKKREREAEEQAAKEHASKQLGMLATLRSVLSCCCVPLFDVVRDAQQELTLVSSTMREPPLGMEPGYANEEGETRGMAPPEYGHIEVVNKTKQGGEIIGIIVSSNAADLALKSHDVTGTVSTYLRDRCMPEQTVVCAKFGEDVQTLQIALFYGPKYRTIEKMRLGNVKDNFEFVKGYQVQCYRKNVLLKFKEGHLQLQQGEAQFAKFMGGRKSVGGGINMKTNITSIEEVFPDATPGSGPSIGAR